MNLSKTSFVPQLTISSGTMEIDFYKNAFNAIELRRWSNDDGSIHVSELEIDGAMFHLHEENPGKGIFVPAKINGITTKIGLMVADVDTVMAKAIAAGGKEIAPAQDYDYGYRQGDIQDPFGHIWMIEKVI
ncbi:MAG: VOC family protein [Bacteroidota bacterium]